MGSGKAGKAFERRIKTTAFHAREIKLVRAHDPTSTIRAIIPGTKDGLWGALMSLLQAVHPQTWAKARGERRLFLARPDEPAWVDFHGHVRRGPDRARAIALEAKCSSAARRFPLDQRLGGDNATQARFLREAARDGAIAAVLIAKLSSPTRDFLVPIGALDTRKKSVPWADLERWRVPTHGNWPAALARWDAYCEGGWEGLALGRFPEPVRDG